MHFWAKSFMLEKVCTKFIWARIRIRTETIWKVGSDPTVVERSNSKSMYHAQGARTFTLYVFKHFPWTCSGCGSGYICSTCLCLPLPRPPLREASSAALAYPRNFSFLVQHRKHEKYLLTHLWGSPARIFPVFIFFITSWHTSERRC
jgi:hypothetical protein